ncbi:MAG TPA: hypothetical protein VEC06_11470 [Paucimonas sp.]|nr:hypothetical protein [Paucimonas sp.]
MALAQSSTSNPAQNIDVPAGTPDVRTQPGGESDARSLGTPPPSQSGLSSGASSEQQQADELQQQPADASQSSGASYGQPSEPSPLADLPPPAPMSTVEPQTINGVTYVCGGVGADEAQMMKRSASDYDMMLTFATRRGEYLADVNVDIKDASGATLMQTNCGGPIMLVDFPEGGTYRVHAEAGGYSLDKTARVSDRQERTASLLMHWPQQIGQSAETSTGSSGSTGASETGGPADPANENR